MSIRNRTHEDFINEIKIKLPNLEILTEYEYVAQKMFVKNKYGICVIRALQLIKGIPPSIKTAINPTEYFINKLKDVHGDRYDYSKVNYKNIKDLIVIICKKHGEFNQQADKHLQKRNCPKCSREIVTKSAQDLATGWQYSNWEKAGYLSKNFDCFKVYIIKLTHENESFFKIGKTFNTIEKRFGRIAFKYKIEIVLEYCSNTKEISKIEEHLKRENKHNKYLPLNKFGGMYECFSKIENFSINDSLNKIFVK